MMLNLPWSPNPQGLLLITAMLSHLHPTCSPYNHRGEWPTPYFPWSRSPLNSPTKPAPEWLMTIFRCPVHGRSTNQTLPSASRESIVYWLENISFLSPTRPSHWKSQLLNCFQSGKRENPSISLVKWLTHSSLSDMQNYLHSTWTKWTTACSLPNVQSVRQIPVLCLSHFKYAIMKSGDIERTFNTPPLNSSRACCPCALVIQALLKALSSHNVLYPWLLVWVLVSSLQDLTTTTSGLRMDSTELGWWLSPGCHDEALELLGHGSFNQDLVITSWEALFIQQSQVHQHLEHAHPTETDVSARRMNEPMVLLHSSDT